MLVTLQILSDPLETQARQLQPQPPHNAKRVETRPPPDEEAEFSSLSSLNLDPFLHGASRL